MKDDIRNLYDALVKNGYSIDDLGGSEENFRANMRDEKIRGEFYDWVVGRDDFNIGSREAYEKRMTGALNPTAEQGIIPELLGVPYPAPEVDKSQYTFTVEQLGLEDNAYEAMKGHAASPQMPEGSATLPTDNRTREELLAERKRLEDAKSEAELRLRTRRGEIASPSGMYQMGMAPVTGNQAAEITDPEMTKLYAAVNSYDNAIRSVDRKLSGEEPGFWEGVADATVRNPGFYTMGLTDMSDARGMLNIAQNGIGGREDELLADAIYSKNAEQQDEDFGFLYRAGNIFGHSVPFMVQTAVTGGFSGASRAGANLAGRLGKKAAEGTIKKKIINAMGTTIDDVIEAGLIANTAGAGGTWANIAERKAGKINIKDGDYVFENGESWMGALYKGEVSSILELYTEKLGGHLEGKLSLTKGLDKIGASRVSNVLLAAKNSDLYKGASTVMRQFGLNGYLPEVLEEEANLVLNSLLVGDNSLSELYNPRTQLDIFGGMLLTVGTMQAIPGTIATAGYVKNQYQLNRADRRAADVFGEEWTTMKEALDNATNEDVAGVVSKNLRDNENQNKALLDYYKRMMIMRGYNIGTVKNETAPDIEEAYTEGYSQEPTGVNAMSAVVEYNQARMDVARALGLAEDADVDAFLNGRSAEEVALGDADVENAIVNYQMQKARKEGLQERFQQTRAKQYEESDRIVDSNVNKANPEMTYSTQLNGQPVYITDGVVALNEDGTIDANNSSETLYAKFPDGHVEMISPDKFTEVFTSDRTADLKAARRAEINDRWRAEFDTAEAQAIEQEKREAGTVFDKADSMGVHRIEILNEGEQMSDILIDGKQEQIPTEELNSWKQEAGIQSTDNRVQRTDAVADDTTDNVAPTGDNVAPVAPVELPEGWDFFRMNGKNYSVASRNDDGSVDVVIDGKRETLPAGTDYSTSMPTDKKGDVQYEQMPVERTHEHFVQKVTDDEARAEMIKKRRNKAEAERKKFDKKPDPGLDPDKWAEVNRKWEEGKKAAQAKVDYWNEVAKREAEITRSETREAVENIKPDVVKETAEEFIASHLPKITPESFKRETGLSNEEQSKLVGVISNEGVTIEQAAESIIENYDSELKALGFTGDMQDVRNVIIDVLSQGNPRSYAKNSREAREAENIEQQRAEAEAWAMGTFNMTLEELYVYDETLLPRLTREFEGFDYNEYYNNLAGNYENDTTRESESIGRGGEVLQGEQSVPASGAPAVGVRNEGGAVSNDVQGGGQNGVAQEEAISEPVGNSDQLSSSEIPNNQSVAEGDAPGQSGVYADNQGNPVDADGKLIVDEVNLIDEITDEDFETPTRNVQLPAIPENVANAIGTNGRPVVIKKNVFEKNGNTHVELEPEDSRNILRSALYNPNLVGSTQPIRRPDYKVAIRTGEQNAIVVLDVYQEKDFVEIVGWRMVNERGLAKMQRQAEREGGQFLILSPNDGSAAALSALPLGLSSASEDRNSVSNSQENAQKSGENAESAPEIQEPRSVEEDLDNGDKRITNYNSRGEVATVAIERDGKVVSVDSYDEGVLFEHTEYDSKGKASLVTRYDKQGNVISTQRYVNGKRAIPTTPQEFADEAKARAEEKRRMRERARELEAQVGVKANIIESLNEVKNREARKRIAAGEAVAGWYSGGQVYLYMPNIKDRREIELTYVHEVVAHHGVKKLLGERFNEFLDGVWNMMSEADRARMLAYVGVKENATLQDMRAAADEYVAELAEKMNLGELEQSTWDKIVDWFKELLEKAGFENLTKEDIESMLKASYANLAKGENDAQIKDRTMFRIADSERRQEKRRINDIIDTAAGFVTVGGKKQATKNRLKKEAERKELAKEMYSSVLKGDFNDVTLAQIDKFIEDATPLNPFGRRISQRLPQRMERALRQGARTNAVDALFSRISESAVPANERFSEAGRREIEERKKELLKGWAIATGNWHTDLKEFTDDTEPIGEGKDSKVYSSKDGRYVIKASKGKPYGKRFRPDIDNIALFNDVFRDTRYEILGYGEIDGEFVRILQQPIVDFAQSTPLTSEERREYMQSLGFEPLNDANTAFADGEIVIADLHKGNVVRDAAGNISVIDADAKLHTKDVGGDYTYPPVEDDLPEQESVMQGQTMFRFIGERGAANLDRAEGVINEFNKAHKGATKKVVVSKGKETLEQQMRDAGFTDFSIEVALKNYEDEENPTDGAYYVSSDGIVIYDTENLDITLWHENTHRAIRKIFDGDLSELQRVYNELPDGVKENIANKLKVKSYSEEDFPEESVCYFVEEMYKNGLLDNKYNLVHIVEQTDPRMKDFANFAQKLINYINNGRKEFAREGEEFTEEFHIKQQLPERNSGSDKNGEGIDEAAGGEEETRFRREVEEAIEQQEENEVSIARETVTSLGEKLNSPVKIIDDLESVPENRRKWKGWFDPKTGEVFVVMPNHVSTEDAVQTVLHETVAHKGLRAVLGEKFDEFLDGVYKDASQKVKRGINDKFLNALKNGSALTVREATEEYIAELAERDFEGYRDTWNAIRQWFRNFFRNFMNMEITDGELRYLLWKNYNRMKSGPIEIILDRAMEANTGTGKVMARTAETFSAVDSYNKNVKGFKNKVKEGWYDEMRSVKVAQEAIEKELGREVLDSENVYLYANHLPSINKNKKEVFDNKYLKPFTSLLKKLYELEVNGQKMDEKSVERYTNAKHGIERNREMSVKKALTEVQDGKKVFNEEAYAAWAQERDAVRKRKLPWTEEQRELDKVAKKYGAKIRDFSGLTAIFDAEGEMKYAQIADAAYKYVADVESTGGKNVKELWKLIKGMTDYSLKEAYESGMMSKSTYEHIKQMYRYYVPLRGFTDQTAEDFFDYVEGDHSPLNAVVKTAKGRTSEAENIFATILNMANSAIVQGSKNRLKQRLLNLAMRSRTGLLSVDNAWYAKVGDEYIPVEYPENADEYAAFEERMKELEKNGEVVRHRPGLEIGRKVADKWNQQQHAVRVKRNGREYVVWVNGDPRLANAVNGMLRENFDETWIGALNRWRAQMVTQYSPTFIFTNLVRDVQEASMTYAVRRGTKMMGNFDLNVAANSVKMMSLYLKHKKGALNEEIPVERYFKEFLENGGETGYTEMISIERYEKQLKKLTEGLNMKNATGRAFEAVGEGVEFANRCIENLCRFSAYQTSREAGMSILKSIEDAKEVSVNFNRKGSGAMGQKYAKVGYMFLNPAIQSLAKRILLTKKFPKKMAVVWAGEFVMGATVPLLWSLIWSMFGDDEDKDELMGNYFNLNDYRRRSGLCLPGKDGVFHIPLSHEARALYGLGELFTSYVMGHEEYDNVPIQIFNTLSQSLPLNPLDGWAPGKNILESMAYNLTPDAVKPIAEVVMNRDFAGNKIHNRSDFNEHLPEYMRGKRGTADIFTDISKLLSGKDVYGKSWFDTALGTLVNPSTLEHLVEGYLGGAYTFADKAIKSTKWALGDEEYAEFKNIPIGSSFYTSLAKYEDKPTEGRTRRDWEDAFRFYDQEVKWYNDKEKAAKNDEKNGEESGTLTLEQMERNGELLMIDIFNDGNEKLKELYGASDVARRNGEFDKVEEIDQQIYAEKRNIISLMEQLADDPMVGYTFKRNKIEGPYGERETYGDVRDVNVINDFRKELKPIIEEREKSADKDKYQKQYDLWRALENAEEWISNRKSGMKKKPEKADELMTKIREKRAEAIELINNYRNNE